MLTRVPQRTGSDCVIATVATVMRPPYTYELVRPAQKRHSQVTREGLHPSLWETYLWEEVLPNDQETDYPRWIVEAWERLLANHFRIAATIPSPYNSTIK